MAALSLANGARLAVLADCHIHAGGPQFPPALLERLKGVDLIVVLGDMGESSGLDQLEAIAPVVGVRGQDDADDRRTSASALRLTQGDLDIGCVFDPTAAGLATSSDPFVESADAAEASRRLFGAHVDLLLYASTHKSGSQRFGAKGMALNPGSAVLPAEGAAPSFLRLNVTDCAWTAELATLT